MKKVLIGYQGYIHQIEEPGDEFPVYDGPDAKFVWVDAPDEVTPIVEQAAILADMGLYGEASERLQSIFDEIGKGQFASIIGRYYAMDRDHRWERTKLAFDAITKGTGRQIDKLREAIQACYDNDETDETKMTKLPNERRYPRRTPKSCDIYNR